MPAPEIPQAGSLKLRAAEWLARFEDDVKAREARRALRHASGIKDDELLERLRGAGLTAETLPALEFVPAILVGWAEGAMSRLERDRLKALAVLRGIGEEHPAWPLLQHWMLQRPSEDETHALLGGLAVRLEQMPPRPREKRRDVILRHCEAIARVVGRRLGGPKISREEREMLAFLEARLST